MKQDRENKMSTPFNPSPFKVVERTGNSVLVESDQGVQSGRNVTHLKKFYERDKPVGQESVSVENSDLVQQPENDLISENVNDTFDSDESLQSESDVTIVH